MEETAVVILRDLKNNRQVDLEVPLNITARELVIGLNEAYNLNIDVDDIKKCYLKVKNPLMLLRGNMLLKDAGIRNGSVIFAHEVM
ncbi:MAG: EsaB/YukD family protein [Lachnospiraceae bacterium]|nr:EsaB/YukD family protein [Lachnospiraceae bacterium]